MNKAFSSHRLLLLLGLSLALAGGFAQAQPAKELPAGSRPSG